MNTIVVVELRFLIFELVLCVLSELFILLLLVLFAKTSSTIIISVMTTL